MESYRARSFERRDPPKLTKLIDELNQALDEQRVGGVPAATVTLARPVPGMPCKTAAQSKFGVRRSDVRDVA